MSDTKQFEILTGDESPHEQAFAALASPAAPATPPGGRGRHFRTEAAPGDGGGDAGETTGGLPAGAAGVIPCRGRRVGTHRTAKFVVGSLGGLALLYLGGVVAWSSVYMPNTTLNGRNVSLQSAKSVARSYERELGSYELAVSGDGTSFSVKASEIGLDSSWPAAVDNATKQENVWAWPYLIVSGNRLEAKLTPRFDEAKLDAIIESGIAETNKGATQPTNASLSYSAESKRFEMMPEKPGTAIDPRLVKERLVEAFAHSKSSVTLDKDVLVQPSITSSTKQLVDAQQQANKMLSATQTLTSNGQSPEVLGTDTVSAWVKVADDLSVSLDKDAMVTWARGDFSKAHDSVGAARSYTRADGKQVSVSGGCYGWCVDGQALADTLYNNISSGSAANVEIPYSSTAATVNPGGADWGNRYIDCDLSEQYARMYDGSGSLIWESSLVSGDPSEDRGTPEGVWAINSNMSTDQTLLGLDENHDGEPDYKSHVNYWMPFKDNLIAFHDAGWRGSFGGSIYWGNGSHGCVNLPPAAAAELFELVEVGDVVVVHS